MALTLTYAEIRRELGRFLGIGEEPTSWAALEVTRVADIIRRGSRRIYFPEIFGEEQTQIHDWSFLQSDMAVTLVDGTTYYNLPDDFIRLTEEVTVSGTSYPLTEVTESELRKLLNVGGTGDPQYFSIKRTLKGQFLGYRIGIYPTPAKAMTLSSWYLFDPPEIDDTNDPICPSVHAETFMSALMATADEVLNYESQGEHAGRFRQLLAASIAYDRSLGGK